MKSNELGVRVLSLDEARERRDELLREAGCSLYDLLEREADYELSTDQLELVRELQRLEFLIGE